MKILLIDDDLVDRMSTKRLLMKALPDLEIDEASSPEKGMEMAKDGHYDIILLDFHLPTMTGLEVLNSLRQIESCRSAIAMLSHSEDDSLALQCIEAGAQDFLLKGEVNANRLNRAILQAKERYRYQMQLVENQQQLKRLAEQDSLTGLANRYIFEKTLRDAIFIGAQNNQKLTLMLLDLDKFKQVNDTLGHDAGDKLLIEIGNRLRCVVRESDLLARLGGDEFAILIRNVESSRLICQIADRIQESMRRPMELNGETLFISASIGVATFPDCAPDAVQLMKCADVAMYHSKEAGRNQTQFYLKSKHQGMENRFEIERELRHAAELGQLELYYQPQIRTENLAIAGVEALVRWSHPERGIISPLVFIPIAEETGLIHEIGHWVFETAMRQMHDWQGNFAVQDDNFFISINVSPLQLSDKSLKSYLEKCLHKYDVDPKHIEIELTENAILDKPGAGQLLKDLHGLGFRLALDDFGTGYSSISQLIHHPFQVIKTDKSFFQPTMDPSQGTKTIKAINAFAKVLGMKVVAEGIETREHQKYCQTLKLDRMQGFYFSKPVQACEIENLWLVPKVTKLFCEVS